MNIFDRLSIIRGPGNQFGWRELSYKSAPNHHGPLLQGKSLLTLIHLSDLHICDVESPSRLEYLDRYADPGSPYQSALGHIGTYRPNEILTTQVLGTTVATINDIERSPLTDSDIDAVIITGDMTDNAQQNETNWYLTTLNGGLVTPSSGASNASYWVGSPDVPFDKSYWHPELSEHGKKDNAITNFGFPVIPGLISAAKASFWSPGLPIPWFATYGNHDALLQGTVAPSFDLTLLSTGNQRIADLPVGFDPLNTKQAFIDRGPANYIHDHNFPKYQIPSDNARVFLTPGEFAQLHLPSGGHGFTELNVNQNNAYWWQNLKDIILISLDTVNPHGGWQGSIDNEQLNWLEDVLLLHQNHYVILLSHHPIQSWTNDYAPPDSPVRVLAPAVLSLLENHNNVIAWIAGHVHKHAVEVIRRRNGYEFIHLTTASQIDWPQQGRVVEITQESDGQLGFGLTVFDHDSPLNYSLDDLSTTSLAGISRLLAANSWQQREGIFAEPDDPIAHLATNVIIRIKNPFQG